MKTYIILFFIAMSLLSGTQSIFAQADEKELEQLFDAEGAVNSKDDDDQNAEKEASKKTVVDERRGPLSFTFVDKNQQSYQLDIMAAADMIGEWDREKDKNKVKEGRPIDTYYDRQEEEYLAKGEAVTDNRGYVRSIELGFHASVDQLADGAVMIAAHDDGGTIYYDIHEAYLYFPTTPIPNVSFKVGRFFIDAGRLNGIHQHDWSFTRPPIVHEKLLANEGVGDFGAQANILMPWNFWQELSIGVYNGRHFGHAHEEGPKKQNPLVTAHLKQFIHLGGNWGTQFGFTYLQWHPDTDPNKITHQSGMDWVVKWKKGKLRSFQWMSEIWYRETRDEKNHSFDLPPDPVSTQVGAYTFFEYQFHEQWLAGLRFDYFHSPTLMAEAGYEHQSPIVVKNLEEENKDLDRLVPDGMGDLWIVYDGWTSGYTVKNATYEGALMLTYKPSEFNFFRTTLTERYEQLYRDWDTILSLQATFIIGLHPAHRY